MRKDSFERFYYEKVGLGEGCGCAEHVTRIRDLDALGQRLAGAAPGRARCPPRSAGSATHFARRQPQARR